MMQIHTVVLCSTDQGVGLEPGVRIIFKRPTASGLFLSAQARPPKRFTASQNSVSSWQISVLSLQGASLSQSIITVRFIRKCAKGMLYSTVYYAKARSHHSGHFGGGTLVRKKHTQRATRTWTAVSRMYELRENSLSMLLGFGHFHITDFKIHLQNCAADIKKRKHLDMSTDWTQGRVL